MATPPNALTPEASPRHRFGAELRMTTPEPAWSFVRRVSSPSCSTGSSRSNPGIVPVPQWRPEPGGESANEGGLCLLHPPHLRRVGYEPAPGADGRRVGGAGAGRASVLPAQRDADPGLQPGHRSDAASGEEPPVRGAGRPRRPRPAQPRTGHHPLQGDWAGLRAVQRTAQREADTAVYLLPASTT